MCHLVDISHHYKIVFMSSTTLWRAVSGARTWFAAVSRWVILLSGISSDCRWPLDVAGRKLCVKWEMNILVTFCINFATRQAERHSVFQVWNVRKICQQSQPTRSHSNWSVGRLFSISRRSTVYLRRRQTVKRLEIKKSQPTDQLLWLANTWMPHVVPQTSALWGACTFRK